MLTKERIARIKECKKLVVKLPLETAIQLEKTENDLVIANRENKRLREALEFYADKENWERTYQDSDIVAQGQLVDYWEPSPIEFDDKGKTARKALQHE